MSIEMFAFENPRENDVVAVQAPTCTPLPTPTCKKRAKDIAAPGRLKKIAGTIVT
jgi:hypothetical protein